MLLIKGMDTVLSSKPEYKYGTYVHTKTWVFVEALFVISNPPPKFLSLESLSFCYMVYPCNGIIFSNKKGINYTCYNMDKSQNNCVSEKCRKEHIFFDSSDMKL